MLPPESPLVVYPWSDVRTIRFVLPIFTQPNFHRLLIPGRSSRQMLALDISQPLRITVIRSGLLPRCGISEQL